MVHLVDATIGIVEALSLGWAGSDLKFIWATDSKHKWDPPLPCWKNVMERIVKIQKSNTMTMTLPPALDTREKNCPQRRRAAVK